LFDLCSYLWYAVTEVNMKGMGKQFAMHNDNRIMEVALYEETKGLTSKTTPQALLERFRYLKQLIIRGSMTLAQMEDRTYLKYGVHITPSKHLSVLERHIKDVKEILRGASRDPLRIMEESKEKKDGEE